MRKFVCLLMSVIIFACAMTVNAQSAAASYDSNDDTVTVSGKFSGVSSPQTVTYYAIRSNRHCSNADVYENSDDITAFGQVKTDSDGNFEISYPFKKSNSKTIENIFVKCNGKLKKCSFSTVELDGLELLKTLPTEFESVSDEDILNSSGLSEKTKKRLLAQMNELPEEMPVVENILPYTEHTVYVSANGSDTTGDGSAENPYGSIQKAISVSENNTSVFLRAGTYVVNDTINIKNMSNIYIGAYENEDVKIVSGVQLNPSEFTVSDNENINAAAKGNVYEYDLTNCGLEINYVMDAVLADNNNAYSIARWPNSDTTGMEKVDSELSEKYPSGVDTGVYDAGPWTAKYNSFVTEDRDVGRYGKNGFEFKVSDKKPFTWNGISDIYMVGSFFAEYITNTVSVEDFNADRCSVITSGTKWTSPRGARYSDKNRFYYANVLDELDIPGEFCIDKSTNKLYVYPFDSVDSFNLSTSDSIETLIEISDSTGVVLSGVDFSNLSSMPISVVSCADTIIQNCMFDNVSKRAVTVSDSRYSGIINCDFIGTGGVRVTNEKDVASLQPSYNFVQNNSFTNSGDVRIEGVSQIVSHNYFTNMPDNCIYMLHSRECVAEYNEFCQSPTRTVDGGVVYFYGYEGNFGNTVRYNYFNNCTTDRERPFTVYIDEMSSYNNVYGNVTVGGGEIYMNSGSENAIYNNLIFGNSGTTPAVEDAMNYGNIYHPQWGSESFRNIWQSGLLKGINKAEYLYDGSYDKFDLQKYSQRYPAFVKYSGLLKKRAEEYKSKKNTVSDYKVAFSNGKETELDYWLRYPRDNYFANNVIVGESTNVMPIQDQYYDKLDIIENNICNTTTSYPQNLAQAEEYYNAEREQNEYLEYIPFEKIGSARKYDSDKLSVVYPTNNIKINSNDLKIELKNNPAFSKYNVRVTFGQKEIYNRDTFRNVINLSDLELEDGVYNIIISGIAQGSHSSGSASCSLTVTVQNKSNKFASYINDISLKGGFVDFNYYNTSGSAPSNIAVAFFDGAELVDSRIIDVSKNGELSEVKVPVTDLNFDLIRIINVDNFENLKPLGVKREFALK